MEFLTGITGIGITNITPVLTAATILASISSLQILDVLESRRTYDRKLTILMKDNLAITIEVLPKTGLFTNKFITHTHGVIQCYPKIQKKDALVYFTVKEASYFEEVPLLKMFNIHSHGDILYVNGKNRMIYNYKNDTPYSRLKPNLTHTHDINVIFG